MLLVSLSDTPGTEIIYKKNSLKIHFLSVDTFTRKWLASLHSAWLESSAACPRPRGGHRKGEKLAPGAFSMLERRGPQGRAHILGVISCQGAERGEWQGQGPSRCFGYCIFVEERGSSGEARRAEPTSPFLVASNQKRQILALVVSP